MELICAKIKEELPDNIDLHKQCEDHKNATNNILSASKVSGHIAGFFTDIMASHLYIRKQYYDAISVKDHKLIPRCNVLLEYNSNLYTECIKQHMLLKTVKYINNNTWTNTEVYNTKLKDAFNGYLRHFAEEDKSE